MMTISTFAQLDLAWMLLRFLPRWRATAGRSILTAYGVATTAAVVLGLGFALVAGRVNQNLSFLRGGGITVAFCLSVVVWGVFAIQDGALTGLGRAVVVPIENSSFAVAKLALLGAFSALLPRWGIFSAWILPVAVSIIPINLLIFRRYLPAHRERPRLPDVLDRTSVARYVAYDYAGGLCGALTTIALPLVVTALLGTDANGLFYIAWTIVLVLDTVALSLGSSLLVEGSYDPGQLQVYARRVVRRGALLLLPAIVAVFLLAPVALSIFGPQYAQESTSVLRILVLGLVPRSIIILYTSIARIRGEVRSVLGVVMASTALILALVYVLSSSFGLNGVAAGWVVGYAVPAIVLVPFVVRMLRSEPAR